MDKVKPTVFIIGETRIDTEGLENYLSLLGNETNDARVTNWKSDASSESEELIEVMGRLCYRSFAPQINKNVSKIREGNDIYLRNILSSGHGSVLEHASVNFIFHNISRVFTHELVRHRVGVGISQESLRFVRLDKLKLWAPTVIQEDEFAMSLFAETFEHLENLQIKLAEHFKLDDSNVPFSKKKTITSAMRRIAPDGLATTIGWTANMRTLRHVIEMRTAPEAEEEIRLVFGTVGKLCKEKYPNLFADYKVELVNGLPHFIPEFKKV